MKTRSSFGILMLSVAVGAAPTYYDGEYAPHHPYEWDNEAQIENKYKSKYGMPPYGGMMGEQPGMGMGSTMGGGMVGPMGGSTFPSAGSAYGAEPSMMAQQDFPAASSDTSLP